MSELSLSSPPAARQIRRRTRRDPNPRFKADTSSQLDAIHGCPSMQVPQDHLAWAVQRVVSRFEQTIVAEVLLKVLAHNVSRLLAAKKLSRVDCWITPDGMLRPLGSVFPATL